MAYVTELANLLTKNLDRFVTLNAYQLAGHCANLEFWISEVEHCLQAIDGYKTRFETMASAQAEFTKQHHSTDWRTTGPFDYGHPPERPKKVPDHERKQAWRELSAACYRFLVRTYNSTLIDRETLEKTAARLNIGIDDADLKR